jgi:transcription factor IIIB subunit 2
MNNFRRSIEEIVQVVKIADTTLKKRLDEFKATPSGSLTLADFRNVWLEEEMDPPAFTKGKEKEEAERLASEAITDEEDGEPNWKSKGKAKATGKKAGKKRKRKRKQGDSEDEEEVVALSEPPPRQPLDPSVLTNSIVGEALEPPLTDDSNIDPALLEQSMPLFSLPTPTNIVDATVSEVLTEEVSTFLQGPQGTMLSEALDEAEQRRLAQIGVVDELLGLDEEELDRFILSEAEVKIKERVWVELNKDYLEALAGEFVSFSSICGLIS